MGRRRELTSISKDISHSLNSRNNDYQGYWTTGQFYKLAQDHDVNRVSINVFERQMQPYVGYFSGIFDLYNFQLAGQLSARRLHVEWVTEYLIEYWFDQEHDKSIHHWIGIGKPYKLILSIKSDLGANYQGSVGGYCRPHDPERECRSSRYDK